jgi:hypothetical protein
MLLLRMISPARRMPTHPHRVQSTHRISPQSLHGSMTQTEKCVKVFNTQLQLLVIECARGHSFSGNSHTRLRTEPVSIPHSRDTRISYAIVCPLFLVLITGAEKIIKFVSCRVGLGVASGGTSEQSIEFGLCQLCFSFVGRMVSIGSGLEPITEIRMFLVVHFFGPPFLALVRPARIVKLAHAASMQIRTALGTFRETTQR